MTPEQFLGQLARPRASPVCLFLGPEPYRRESCLKALIERVLPEEEREGGVTRHDLETVSLSEVVDDARSLSLFAPRRVIRVASAEEALPRARGGAAEEQAESGGGPAAALARYVENPTPGVILVLEATRYDLEGEDKSKADRLRKFYSAVPAHVEFPRFTLPEARQLAADLARKAGLPLDRSQVEWMVEALGPDAMRIAAEIEKLSMYSPGSRKLGLEDLAALIPDVGGSTVFALVDALGRRDRLAALRLLDNLVRQGEYLPLALSFLATLFRLALVAKERGLRSAQQIQQQLSAPGRPVWRSRAEQIHHTATVFSREQLETGLRSLFETDRALRDARPDDRIVMENLIVQLAG